MKNKKHILRDTLRFLLGKKGYTYLRFIITHHYFPSFKKPKTFSEKIIYRKFNTEPSSLSLYVDKYTVRQYVEDTIGKEYLIPLIKKCNYIKPEDFDSLPNSFVIKTSNGGGGNNVLLVEDKSKLNIIEICDRFNSYISMKVGAPIDELFYDIEKPYIIFEEMIKHADGRLPSDYKIHIFNNNSKTNIFIQVDTDRFGNHKRSIYDESLKLQPFKIQPKYDPVESNYNFPDNMDKLILLSKSLSKNFHYVRVDMYNVDRKIYFGEMTFCHGSGWEPISPKSADLLLGKLWNEYH
ncbi:ATP-grasp fold amidoligase family protein [Providencia rettgeri]|uniref:ATP-grasp fold amidoligase family protein n=1 Tax=Providencia TaxID=586 RepID=UPI002349ECAE|nr:MULTISPECIES: ATP-grasp fold amidoligase family protein [unclassified Providencia]